MSRTNIFFPVLTGMINAKFPNLAQWRLKYSDIIQKKENLLQPQRRQFTKVTIANDKIDINNI